MVVDVVVVVVTSTTVARDGSGVLLALGVAAIQDAANMMQAATILVGVCTVLPF